MIIIIFSCSSFKSNLLDSFHAQKVEAHSHDLADGLEKEDSTGFLRGANAFNSAIVLSNLNCDVKDEVSDTVNLQISNS